MFQIVDRRLAGKNKSVGNRERFLERYKGQIKEAHRRVVDERGMKDVAQDTEIRIPKRDINQPVFRHGEGGVRDLVHPGNREFIEGDQIDRPSGGKGGQRGTEGSEDDEVGEDDFRFSLSKDEFMRIFFDDLELPRLMRSQLADITEWKSHRAGYSHDGTPGNLHVVRSMRGALGRRIALSGGDRSALRDAEEALAAAVLSGADPAIIQALKDQVAHFKGRVARVPYLDPIDLMYRNRVRTPAPVTRAVMFCLMDISGSMDEGRKSLSKRFFILLHLFLTRHYEKIDLVFIRHHTQAKEVDEEGFFHATETGGTVVSSAIKLTDEIIRARYASGGWNIYVAQASDGDNYAQDTIECVKLLRERILPLVRYYAYIQVASEEQSLWEAYKKLAQVPEAANFAMKKALHPNEIHPVFQELFKKQGVSR